MNMQAKNYSDMVDAESSNANHHNISSVLSRIQDDGPAYARANKRNNLVDFQTENKSHENRTHENKIEDNRTQETKQPYHDEVNIGLHSATPDLKPNNVDINTTTKKNILIKWLLVLFTAVILVFMYKLDARNSEIEALLDDYDEEVQSTLASYTRMSPKLQYINKTLKSVKQDIALIKTKNIEDKNIKDIKQANQEGNSQERENNEIVENNIIDMLNAEILALKDELIQVNNKLNQGKVNNSQDDKKIAEKNKTTGWIVTLASSTNKTKIDEIAEQLNSDGLAPFVEEAMVEEQRVYRLIVGGFSNFKQAESFLPIADEKYGMKDGWIRKGNNG